MANNTNRGPNPSTMAVVNRVIDDLHGSLGLPASQFFCECGHPGCKERITLTRAEYAILRTASRPVYVPSHADQESAELQELRRKVHQLETALTSRVVIEQAKGVVAERNGVTPDSAFKLLRKRARDERRALHEVCAETVAGVKTTNAEPSESAFETRASLRRSDPRGDRVRAD